MYVRPIQKMSPKKQVEITNEDEQQHMADLKRLVEELIIMTKEINKKEELI